MSMKIRGREGKGREVKSRREEMGGKRDDRGWNSRLREAEMKREKGCSWSPG